MPMLEFIKKGRGLQVLPLAILLLSSFLGVPLPICGQTAPAANPSPVRTRLPDPGRFDPYPEYLDSNSAAVMNFRLYSSQRKTAGFDTIRALREEREKRLRARPAWLGGPGATVPVRQETVYQPVSSAARAKQAAPASPVKPTPASRP